MKRCLTLAVFLLLASSAVVFVCWRESAAPADSVAPTYGATLAAASSPAVKREVAGAQAWLDVRVEGSPAWIRAGALSALSASPSAPPTAWDPAFANAAYTDGCGRLAVQPSTWSWVHVRPSEPSAPIALVRVSPLVGVRELRVVLPSAAALHVLVLEGDGLTPAAGAQVVVEQHSPTGSFSAIGNATTDPSGYARLAGLPDGQVVVRSANSAVTDPEPLAVRRVLQGRGGLADQLVTLLLPSARRRLELEVDVAVFPADLALTPRVYLRDPHSGRVVPVRAPLKQGANQVKVDVESGDYLIDCLPFGSFTSSLEGGVLRVSATQDVANVRVLLRANHARTRLVLGGLRAIDFPLRVCLRDPSLPVHPDERLMFYGPLSWHGATAEVPSLFSALQIVACTKQGWLASREAVRIEGSELRVELMPACCAQVVWRTHERPVRPVVVVRGTGPTLTVPLGLVTDDPPAPPVVFFRSEVVVLQGAAVFTCSAENGAVLWQREVNLSKPLVEVTP